jgi:SAM-dependent methyltransferase
MVETLTSSVSSMLDLGTGGGEFLLSLSTLPEDTMATEAYSPNVEIARSKVAAFGIHLINVEAGIQERYPLPLPDSRFDLVIDRHEAYDSSEIMRILKPGGRFITQQVGSYNLERLRLIFGSLVDSELDFVWNLEAAKARAEGAGLQIVDSGQALTSTRFSDVRTVVYYLKALAFDFPHFDPRQDMSRLGNIAFLIERDGFFEDSCDRFFLTARKPLVSGKARTTAT